MARELTPPLPHLPYLPYLPYLLYLLYLLYLPYLLYPLSFKSSREKLPPPPLPLPGARHQLAQSNR